MKATLSAPKSLITLMEDVAALEADIVAIAAEGLEAGAEVALEGMRKRVPVRKGVLKANLKRGPVKVDGNVVTVDIGLLDDTPEDVARYGNAQEFGSSSMAAQPYIRPTMAEDKGRITKALAGPFKERGLSE
mgnify:CR=1 FL=1|jgi:HK97 gp10 family phage protein